MPWTIIDISIVLVQTIDITDYAKKNPILSLTTSMPPSSQHMHKSIHPTTNIPHPAI